MKTSNTKWNMCESKISYEDRGKANRALREIKKSGYLINPAFRAYKCPLCGRFHLSSNPVKRK